MKRAITSLTRAALIAALYFALSVALKPLAFGPVQFRLSEALVLLPVILPEAVPGLAIGCLISNFFLSPYGLYDMLLGGAATLVAACLSCLLRRRLVLAALPPILLNALVVPLIWLADGSDSAYFLNFGLILASEAVVVLALGIPLVAALKKAFVRAGIIRRSAGEIPYARKLPDADDEPDDSDDA